MSFISLPEVIYQQIQTFLTHDDNHYFLATNKWNFSELRRKTIYFCLTNEMSLEYVHNRSFTSLVLSKVENGWKQIQIRIRVIDYPLPKDLPIHRINFCCGLNIDLAAYDHIEQISGTLEIREIPLIPKIKVLNFFDCKKLADVRNLSHLQRLEISSAHRLTDITPLQNIPVLELSNCDSLQDFEVFNEGKQVQLSLKHCPLLKDVSPFRRIRILSITLCNQIRDVSPLYGIYDLTLSNCFRIRDISKLGNHHRLSILSCAAHLIGFASLDGIPHIKLYSVNISNVTVLSKAKTVWLGCCPNIEDIHPIKNVRKVSIHDCSNIKNIHELADIPDLTLFGSFKTTKDKEEELIPLRNRRLFLSLHSNDYDFSSSNYSRNNNHYVRDLSIYQCSFVETFLVNGSGIFQNLQSLLLNECSKFSHVHGLGSIPTLRLLRCHDLKDISALGGNRCVELAHCQLIADVSSLATVPIVTIRCCTRIKDYHCLEKVPRLKIIK